MMSNELDTETNAIKKKPTDEKKIERRISFDELYKIHIDGWCSTVYFPRYVFVPEENIETSFSISFRKSTILSSILFSPRFAVERTQLQFSSFRQHTQWTMNITFYVVNKQKKLETFAFVWNSRYTPDSERMMYVSRIQPNAICITNPQESTLLFNLSLASNPIVNTNLHVHLFWSQTFFNSFEVKRKLLPKTAFQSLSAVIFPWVFTLNFRHFLDVKIPWDFCTQITVMKLFNQCSPESD